MHKHVGDDFPGSRPDNMIHDLEFFRSVPLLRGKGFDQILQISAALPAELDERSQIIDCDRARIR